MGVVCCFVLYYNFCDLCFKFVVEKPFMTEFTKRKARKTKKTIKQTGIVNPIMATLVKTKTPIS